MSTPATPAVPAKPLDLKGVSFEPPPASIMGSVNRQIDSALAALPPDKFLVAVVDVKTTTGINAAVVAKIDDNWSVMGYVAKHWGEPIEGGASVRFAK